MRKFLQNFTVPFSHFQWTDLPVSLKTAPYMIVILNNKLLSSTFHETDDLN